MLANYIHIYSGVCKSKRASKGISLLINKKYHNNLINWDTISERIITANFLIHGHKISVIAAYGPNEDAPGLEKEEFYDQLNYIMTDLEDQREYILLGDINARVGSRRDSKIIGRFGDETLNNNGRRLIEVCQQHELKILNGFYQHKNIHRYTWHQDTRGLRSIIDYIIIKQAANWKVTDTRNTTQCGSDHYLSASKFHIPCNPECTSQHKLVDDDITWNEELQHQRTKSISEMAEYIRPR